MIIGQEQYCLLYHGLGCNLLYKP